jgi:hypothetical protein
VILGRSRLPQGHFSPEWSGVGPGDRVEHHDGRDVHPDPAPLEVDFLMAIPLEHQSILDAHGSIPLAVGQVLGNRISAPAA